MARVRIMAFPESLVCIGAHCKSAFEAQT